MFERMLSTDRRDHCRFSLTGHPRIGIKPFSVGVTFLLLVELLMTSLFIVSFLGLSPYFSAYLNDLMCLIYIGLHPGHTHEDVDAMFSVIKQALVGTANVSQGVKDILLRTFGDLSNFLKSKVFKSDVSVTR